MKFHRLAGLIGLNTLLIFGCSGSSPDASPAAGSEANATGFDDFFVSTNLVDASITAPTARLIHDQRVSPDATPEAEGFLDFGRRRFPVTITIRGYSSKDVAECPFPKMTLTFPAGANLAGTPFAGHTSLRLDTHCESATTERKTPFGRVANQLSPTVEDLVYRLVRALDVPTYQSRLARINWVDSEDGAHGARPPAAADPTIPATTTFRNGLFIEATDHAVTRFSKQGLIPAGSAKLDVPTAAKPDVTVNTMAMGKEKIAAIYLAQSLIRNDDWQLNGSQVKGTQDLWNIDLFGTADKVLPVPQDFDLAGIATDDGSPNADGVDRLLACTAGRIDQDVLLTAVKTMLPRQKVVEQELASSRNPEISVGATLKHAEARASEFFTVLKAFSEGTPIPGKPNPCP